MNRIKHILYGFICLVAIVAIPLFGNDVRIATSNRLNIKELPRINGELDFSKIDEIVLKSAEKTQFVGRFGIVAAHIDDLVQVPEFVGFRPVVVIGKLTYRREGKSYVCHIQWEKVCLITPAFNKVKRLDKGLASRFNHSGIEISKDFLMTAKGDVPVFIKNVKELFSVPVATESDLTDKEKEKLKAFTHNYQKSTSSLDGSGINAGEKRDGYRGSMNSDSKGKSEKYATGQGHRQKGGDSQHANGSEKEAQERGLEVASNQSPKDKEAEKEKQGKTSGVSSDGVDPSRRDGDVPQVNTQGGGGAGARKNGVESESRRDGSDAVAPYQYSYDQGSGSARDPAASSFKVHQASGGDGAKTRDEEKPLSGSSSPEGANEGDYMGATTDGCTIRVDLNQLRAVQQERLIVRRNGKEERSPCKDGNVMYTIHKDYGHPYKIDLSVGKAYPQYSYYYLDGTGRRKNIRIEGHEIEIEVNNPVVLKETGDGCSPKPEYGRDSTTMLKCKRKFYIKHSGEKEFATNCLETGIKARVEWTTEGCEVDHNFTTKQSFIQKRRVYKFPDEQSVTEYSRCEHENREPIPHKTEPCEPEVENGKWFERNRTEIKLNGRNIVIRPCERVSLSGKPLEKEYTCTYSHLADKSHPYMRKYYTFNGNKQYVTGLEVDLTVAYPHVKRVLSYENKDNTKHAIPIEQYYFKGVNNQEVDVRIAQGAPVAYENTLETEIKNEGTSTYDGCNKVTRRFKYLKWKRPDGSYYFEKTNEEEPIREYACQTEYVIDKKVLKTCLKFDDEKYSITTPSYHDGPSTSDYGTGSMVSIEETGNKTLDEMKIILENQKRSLRNRYNGKWKNYKLVRFWEESTYAITKRNGQTIGEKKRVSYRTFDET